MELLQRRDRPRARARLGLQDQQRLVLAFQLVLATSSGSRRRGPRSRRLRGGARGVPAASLFDGVGGAGAEEDADGDGARPVFTRSGLRSQGPFSPPPRLRRAASGACGPHGRARPRRPGPPRAGTGSGSTADSGPSRRGSVSASAKKSRRADSGVAPRPCGSRRKRGWTARHCRATPGHGGPR